ncbi:hypothetical protein MPSEU_000888300 [Mayamaea pseudoterrestris]|nr:hypothetical protein MPSEU_000888300 [Mayamaea pseudoterrestris]
MSDANQRDPAHPDHNQNDDNDTERLLENALIPALMEMAISGQFDPETCIDRSKARLLLQVTDNNVDLAAQLYWDDWLATQQQQQDQGGRLQQAPQQDDGMESGDDEAMNEAPPPHEEAAAANNEANNAQQRPVMELLPDDEEDYVQRLDGIFERAHRNELHVRRPPAGRRVNHGFAAAAAIAGGEGAEDYVAAARRFMDRARRMLNGQEADDDFINGNEVNDGGQIADRNVQALADEAAARARRFLAQARIARQEEEEDPEHVSISDDEIAAGSQIRNVLAARSRIGSAVSGDTTSSSLKRSAMDILSSTRSRRRKLQDCLQNGMMDENDFDVNGFLSDNDWIWGAIRSSRRNLADKAPMELLWGLPAEKAEVDAETDVDSNAPAVNNDHDGDDSSNERVRRDDDSSMNVIADDDVDDDSTNNNDGPPEQITGIPTTWLNASFQLDKGATGIAIFPPSEDDIGYFAWQARQKNQSENTRASVPPPYHCRAITSIASIVTALIHTGVHAHRRQISPGWRKPFLELDKDDRKREFHDRLADALACLLVIAANASAKRKETALHKLKEEAMVMAKKLEDDVGLEVLNQAEKGKWHILESKLQLCPTCVWEHEPEVQVFEGRCTSRNVSFTTSYTNINDLRSFVKAQMNQFTSSGGMALFLENILRFHGEDAVKMMISLSRRLDSSKTNDTSHTSKCLINCTCHETFRKKLEECTTAAKVRSQFPYSIRVDTSPPGHGCFSTELLSLLLTGRVCSSLEGWSTGSLCFGILTDSVTHVSKGLTRPERPIWVLRGPTLYSALWVDYMKGPQSSSFDPRFDQPGSAAIMTHWNPWFGERRKTNFRMILDRDLKEARDAKATPLADEVNLKTSEIKSMSLLADRQNMRAALSKVLAGTETFDPSVTFTRESLDRIVANPDDQKYYPRKYQLWRFDMGEEPGDNQEDKKPRGVMWKPFHRLTSSEKILVEAKLGPKIRTMLWMRWPRATVDSFEPADPEPIV